LTFVLGVKTLVLVWLSLYFNQYSLMKCIIKVAVIALDFMIS